jgi:bile acid-coenzyme A ligase
VVRGVAPISTQISSLAQAAPDFPPSPVATARSPAPTSIEWIQAVIACWKLGAVPQPLSARLPDAEIAGILDLLPRALIVGRPDPRGGETPTIPRDFVPDPNLSDVPLPEAVSPVWKSMTSGGSTGRPKLTAAGQQAPRGHRLPARHGRG